MKKRPIPSLRLSAAATAALLAFGIGSAPSARANALVTIDYGTNLGTITHPGSGHLYAFTTPNADNYPSGTDGTVLTPIKPRCFRVSAESAPAYIDRLIAQSANLPNGLIIVATVSSNWLPRSNNTIPPWTNNWSAYISDVTGKVQTVEAKRASLPSGKSWDIIYDVWNEPDQDGGWWEFEGATWDLFHQTYLKAFTAIRDVNGNAKITGPGLSNASPTSTPTLLDDPELTGQGELGNFIQYCQENSCVPNYWNWHAGGDDIPANVQWAKDYAANLNITPAPGVCILEYTGPQQSMMPGRLAWEISLLTEAGVYRACKANWGNPPSPAVAQPRGTLNGCLADDYSFKRGIWHVFKFYGEMTGIRAGSTSNNGTVKALASIDSASSQAWALLANKIQTIGSTNNPGTITLTINNVQPATGTTVHVTVTNIPYANYGAVNSLPTPVIDGNYTVDANHHIAGLPTFAWNAHADAFQVSITNVKPW